MKPEFDIPQRKIDEYHVIEYKKKGKKFIRQEKIIRVTYKFESAEHVQ